MSAHQAVKALTDSVAVIDIGSNAVRMAVAQVHPGDDTEVLERLSRPVRLGQDAFVKGKLSQEAMGAAIDVLRDYRKVLDTYRVKQVRAVATSAVREATNRDAFVDRISMTVGIDVDVIEPAEQSMLIVSAVRHALDNAVDMAKHQGMIVEVGGGSTLLTVLRRGEIAASESYNLGSIRMQEMLATTQETPERASRLLRQQISNAVDLASRSLGLKSVRTFVAIGGDARFAARHAGEPIPNTDLMSVDSDRFEELTDRCATHSAEELCRVYGLAYADAETLAPALLVYNELLQATKAHRMIVSTVSMRDGLLLDMPRFITGRQDPALTKSILLSARTIGAKYRCDARHAEHVGALAVRLFDELQDLHGLKPRHRLLLNVAALLHEIGMFVSNRAHHKHSYYLISNAQIFGLREQDNAAVAHVARYHRRSVPKRSHLDYMALPRQQRMVVNKLAAILRIADALDRGHWQQVRKFSVERRGNEMVIYAAGAGDLAMERRALAGKADLFQDVFGLSVRLEEELQEPTHQASGAAHLGDAARARTAGRSDGSGQT